MSDEKKPEADSDQPDPGALVPAEDPGGDLPAGIPHYVTDIRTVERQVGENIIATLQHPETVGVLSAVLHGGIAGQRIVSVPLSQRLFQQVQELLAEAQAEEGEPRDVPCIGFQCVLEEREKRKDTDEDDRDS